ncbi:hypothetical protein [Pseudomonas glycinae]|uniref:hypothetical protein n=1 Tax=Pseudomonas glycinae TaxID=1785145 RepID=UPI00167CE0C1|nr:hypothetical protein [Pseudomonas glycinae]
MPQATIASSNTSTPANDHLPERQVADADVFGQLEKRTAAVTESWIRNVTSNSVTGDDVKRDVGRFESKRNGHQAIALQHADHQALQDRRKAQQQAFPSSKRTGRAFQTQRILVDGPQAEPSPGKRSPSTTAMICHERPLTARCSWSTTQVPAV